MSNADLIKRLLQWSFSKDMADDLVDVLTSAAAELEAQEWRTDMENAPRDGTHVMAMAGDMWPVSVTWVKYDPDVASELGDDGYWRYSDEALSDIAEVASIDYWKPLDTPPDTQNT